jgi:hypothetical protein
VHKRFRLQLVLCNFRLLIADAGHVRSFRIIL